MITILVLECVWEDGFDTILHSNAQRILRQAIIKGNLSPIINDTAELAKNVSVLKCEMKSKREAECKAVIRGFRIWNVSFLHTVLTQS